METHYSIHNIVALKLIGRIPRRLKIEYENFETDKIINPDITIYLGNFTPSTDGCQLLDSKYYVRENYLFYEDTYKIGKWKLELSGFESGNITARLHTNMVGSLAADMFICAYNIDPLIRFVMNQKGYSAIHAAAVSRNGQAFLFPAQSGAGKTTTASYFAQEGFDFQGDDFVILKDGYVYNWLTPFNVFEYNFNKIIRENTSISDTALIKLKNFIYRASSGYIKVFSKLNPATIFSTVPKSKIEKVFFLMPGNGFAVHVMDKDELNKRLFFNLEMESFPAYRYMLEYAYAFPNSNMAGFFDNYKINLNNNLPDSLAIYSVEVPRKYTEETFRSILSLVD